MLDVMASVRQRWGTWLAISTVAVSCQVGARSPYAPGYAAGPTAATAVGQGTGTTARAESASNAAKLGLVNPSSTGSAAITPHELRAAAVVDAMAGLKLHYPVVSPAKRKELAAARRQLEAE